MPYVRTHTHHKQPRTIHWRFSVRCVVTILVYDQHIHLNLPHVTFIYRVNWQTKYWTNPECRKSWRKLLLQQSPLHTTWGCNDGDNIKLIKREHKRSLLLWDIAQYWLIVTDVLGQSVPSSRVKQLKTVKYPRTAKTSLKPRQKPETMRMSTYGKVWFSDKSSNTWGSHSCDTGISRLLVHYTVYIEQQLQTFHSSCTAHPIRLKSLSKKVCQHTQ